MMPQAQTKQSTRSTRHSRAANPKAAKPATVAAPHKPGSPPNLCIVASPEELTYISDLGWGKAGAVHTALRLLREVQSGSIKLVDPLPDYVTQHPKALKKTA